ncbi:zinc-dependent alcohol dehydrogenase family protein [Erythrobacter sp. AP23]|uniref:zinc-dependent alcohol dehydrogenase family protein n=1 Tax=Erythrobacter sp. AP23 TaxID=499656 RepID=UPI000ADA3944|nr:zinc-dependent alcohol dehydrogenase family protein [Erythrobacter sp. AP23]
MNGRPPSTGIMRAMEFKKVGSPLEMVERAMPAPGASQVVVQVAACGVCRTDLHVVDGDIRGLRPIVPGHEIVGRVVAMGDAVTRFDLDDRIGVPWLGATCGECRYCRTRQENLCDAPQFTGFSVDGGFASHALAEADYCFALPPAIDDAHAAPLLCAGLIGYRAFGQIGDAQTIGFYGFGASAHILAQIATSLGCTIAAFTRPGDEEGQEFARGLGCAWAGGSDVTPPFELDAAIIFAPVGALVPLALSAVRKGGTVVCAGIHMSDIPAFPYELLWGERKLRSVANLTRADGEAFFAAIADLPVRTRIERFALDDANEALDKLRNGRIKGAAVVVP